MCRANGPNMDHPDFQVNKLMMDRSIFPTFAIYMDVFGGPVQLIYRGREKMRGLGWDKFSTKIGRISRTINH